MYRIPVLPAPSRRHVKPLVPWRVHGLATLITLLVAGCATPLPPVSATHASQQASAASTPAGSASVADAANRPTATEDTSAVVQAVKSSVITPATLKSATNGDGYGGRADARALAQELAQTQQLDEAWVWSVLSTATYKENAARLMMPAPAGVAKNWAAYRSRFIEPIRIRAGQTFWQRYEADLRRAEAQYGVPAEIIVGIIGVETIYGRNAGNFRVLDVLTTLTLDFPNGRSDRSPFFKKELGAFLKLCLEQNLAPTSVLGSYAGAIGWPQFMPSSIRSWGIDFDGDGQIDLQRSPVDAIGSVAHYLSAHGWHKDWPTHFEITPPQDSAARAKLLAPDIVPSFSAQEMRDMGATLPEAALNHAGRLALVMLENGADLPTMIAGTDNFYVITRYNQSSYYALAVIELGQAVSRAVIQPKNTP